MQLSVPFVITAFLAWQANAGSFYGKADISHDRVGAAHRMVVRARNFTPEPVAEAPALPQESLVADPAVDNLMARIKTDIRPINVAAFNGNLIDPEADPNAEDANTKPISEGTEAEPVPEAEQGAVENEPEVIIEETPVEGTSVYGSPEDGDTGEFDHPDEIIVADPDSGEILAPAASYAQASDEETSSELAPEESAAGDIAKRQARPTVANPKAKASRTTPTNAAKAKPNPKVVKATPATKKQSVKKVAAVALSSIFNQQPAPTGTAQKAPEPAPPAVDPTQENKAKAVIVESKIVQDSPVQVAETSPEAKPVWTKPAPPPGFTGVDLFNGPTPTFVPNPPTFGAKPPSFGKRAENATDEVVEETVEHPDPKEVLEEAIEAYLVETNSTLSALAADLAADAQNATVALDTGATQPIVAASDLDNPMGEVIERPNPVALNDLPSVANNEDPLNLLAPTPVFVPNPPTFEKRRKRRAF